MTAEISALPYLLDSDVLIDVSRGNPAAREYLDALPEGWAQVSALELIVGARDNRDLTKSHGLHVFDSLVAATAIEESLTLVTRNRRHFGMIESLSLLVPQY
jgi:predicted nucleic acid-binding protein